MSASLDTLIRELWPQGDSLGAPQIHMLADGARDPAIAPLVRFGKLDYTCLYAEPLSPRLRAAAPYLVHLAAASAQSREMLRRCGEDNWGILVGAPACVTTRQLRLHFKKLLWAEDERRRRLAFRFYDPRVLRTYLPGCTADELRTVFGPATALYCLDGTELTAYASPLQGSRGQGVVTVRDGQMDALAEARRRSFAGKALDFLRSEHPRRFGERGEAEVAFIVRRYTGRIVAHGVAEPVRVISILETLVLGAFDPHAAAGTTAVEAAFGTAGPSFDELNDALALAVGPGRH